jgi:hypothetical protein
MKILDPTRTRTLTLQSFNQSAVTILTVPSSKFEFHGHLPLWSSGQSSWLQIQSSGFDSRRYQIFLRSSGSGTGSTQPREYNWGVTWKKKLRLQPRKQRLRPCGIRLADYVKPLYPQKVDTNFADKRLFGRYSSLADSDHGVCFFVWACIGCTDIHTLLYGSGHKYSQFDTMTLKGQRTLVDWMLNPFLVMTHLCIWIWHVCGATFGKEILHSSLHISCVIRRGTSTAVDSGKGLRLEWFSEHISWNPFAKGCCACFINPSAYFIFYSSFLKNFFFVVLYLTQVMQNFLCLKTAILVPFISTKTINFDLK